MLQSILNDRLQGKLRNQLLLHRWIDLPLHLKIIVMHDQLDFQISFNIPDTGFHSYHICSLTECCPVKCRQCQSHTADLLLSALNRHPVYNRKGIIKKMWIDLGSQRFQFKFLQGNLVFIHFFNQSIDLIHHMVKASHQLSYLISRITVNRNFTTSLVHLFHISGKLLDLSCKQLGKRHSQHNDDHNTETDQWDLTDQHF